MNIQGDLAGIKLRFDCEMAIEVEKKIESGGYLPELLARMRKGETPEAVLKSLNEMYGLTFVYLKSEEVLGIVARRLAERAKEKDADINLPEGW